MNRPPNYLSAVPIATRQPEPNAQFEIHDITQRFRWKDGTMDFIHARNIDLAVRLYQSLHPFHSSVMDLQVTSYPALLQEVARLLRPDGLFFSGEIGRSIDFAHNFSSDPAHQVPRARHFYDVVNHSLSLRHLNLIADRIPYFIRHSQQFTVPIIQTFHIPIGDWHQDTIMRRVGKRYLAALKVFAENLTPMLCEAGMTQYDAEALVNGFIDDIESVRGLVGVYHTVWARKL
jgi:SAM-dependent methyltransferase